MHLGTVLRDEAMSRVDAHADDDWKQRALDAVKAIPVGETFTTDRLWETVEKPREPRAAGPVMRRAAKQGLIAQTGGTRLTVQASGHRRPLTVWRRRRGS